MKLRFLRFSLLLLLTIATTAACERLDPDSAVVVAQLPNLEPIEEVAPSPTAASPITETLPPPTPILSGPSPTAVQAPTPSAGVADLALPVCGQLLPAVPPRSVATHTSLTPDETALAQLQEMVPAAAEPALRRLLAAPETVGLVAYQMGQEDQGIFLNPDTPMPLASVVKIIHLVAYVEAMVAGELNPLEPVSLEELETYYLPGYDLGAHRRALEELESNGRLLTTTPPTVLLEDVPWMMIRHSSNAATDYLHQRLGQRRIEETARKLGLTNQSAPCPFLGQFLLVSNHTRGDGNDLTYLSQLLDPLLANDYGREVMQLTHEFQSSAIFREAELAWRASRRPSLEAQRFFSEYLNAQGTAREYAALMLRLAQNGLSNPDSSFHARRYLEWAMHFPVNQELFSNLGYKGGSMPGVLTGAYYAYRPGEVVPVVVALFYHDLPQETYRQWRDDFPHDELARWLLSDPQALPALRAVLSGR